MPPDTTTTTTFLFAAGTAVFLLVLFRLVQRLFSGAHTIAQDGRGTNVAYLLVQAGHVLAALMLVPGITHEALSRHHESLGQSILWGAAFAATGIVLIQVVGAINTRLLLRATLARELERGNVAAGLAAGANYVAIGQLAGATVAGSDLQGLGLSIAFFGIAVVTLAIHVALFRALTTYDDQEQIQGENLAAAVSYAGVSIAVSVVLARALSGDEAFPGWQPALVGYGLVAATGLLLYPVRQLLVQGLILGRSPTLRGGALDDAIGTERNTGLATIEALAYLATALAIAGLH